MAGGASVRRRALAAAGRIGVVVAALLVTSIATTATASAATGSRSYLPIQQDETTYSFKPVVPHRERLLAATLWIPATRSHPHAALRNIALDRVRHSSDTGNPLVLPKPDDRTVAKLRIAFTSSTDSGGADCGVDPVTMTAPTCTVLRNDTASAPDPEAGLWGNIECASDSRYQYETAGGDPHLSADGSVQGNGAFRRLAVLDGDDFWGERCELGRNTNHYGENSGSQTSGTFALYGGGEHRVTFFSERYPASFPKGVQAWQTVAQMKQAMPADNVGTGPVLELQLFGDRLRLQNNWHEAWSTRAPDAGTWIRYALDVTYSPDSDVGSVQMYVDLNGDGDALDSGEESPRLSLQTMLAETNGPNGTSDGLAPGDPIPDHLRLGIYHNSSIVCPPPDGCALEVDNVQVVG